MLDKLTQELKLFRNLLTTKFNPNIVVERLCSDAFKLTPPNWDHSAHRKKTITMTFLALVHGNEVGGIAVLNRLLYLLANDIIALKFPVAFVLGNVDAALSGVRFLEHDLNRCFASSSHESKELLRAKELEPILFDSEYVIDLHQTIEKTKTPFFIFPFDQGSFSFATFLENDLPIITHWGQSFSKEGKCSDEFVHASGGIAVTLELGQKSFDIYQQGLGLNCLLKALVAPLDLYWKTYNATKDRIGQVYTWGQVVPFPEGNAQLDKGWYNFREVKSGDRIGVSESGDLIANCSGPILFPKYGSFSALSRPKEICRILRTVTQIEIEELFSG